MNTHRDTSKMHKLPTRLMLTCLLAFTTLAASAQTEPTADKRFSASEYRVVEVAVVTGDDHASGTALLNANASAASSGERWLLLLSPGTFDLGDRNLVMDENVSIQGAGMESTFIVGNGTTSTSLGEGLLKGADSVRLAELTVRCTNATSTELCIAMANVDASPRLHRVRIDVSGPGLHWGMRNTNSSPILEEVEIYASGGIHNYGVVNAAASHPEIQRSLVTTENGSEQNVAVFDKDGGLVVRVDDSEFYAIGGTHAIGLYNDGSLTSEAILVDTAIHVSSGSTVNAAIFGGNYTLHLQGSAIVADGPQAIAAELDSYGILLATHSQLLADGTSALAGEIQLGSIRVGAGTVAGTIATCAGVFRLGSSPEFFTDTCPDDGSTFVSKSTIRIFELGD